MPLMIQLLLFSAFHANWFLSALIGAIPFGGTLTYVILFKQGKPPGYDRDLFELWITGKGFSLIVSQQAKFRCFSVTP